MTRRARLHVAFPLMPARLHVVPLHVDVLSLLSVLYARLIEQNKVYGVNLDASCSSPTTKQTVAMGNQSLPSIFRHSFHFRALAEIHTTLNEEAEASLRLDFLPSLAHIPPSPPEAPLALWEWVFSKVEQPRVSGHKRRCS